ncbi:MULTISPECIES: DUF6261 family protein [unclassified Saccharicrinis]|uniref:DUF6261 family protein n=1 Tax=unclassified Saccharicrinis TaxID=2646859 RepID=UPI003D358B1F
MPSIINYRSNVEEIKNTALGIVEIFGNDMYVNDSYLTEVISTLRENTSKMIDSLNEEIVKSTLAPLDSKRDNSARVIFLEVKSKILWPDEKIAQAAQTIMDVLNKYGMEVIHLSYREESECLKSMLEDFEKDEIAAACSKLHDFDILIDQLKKDQEIFEKAFQEYLSKKEEKRNLLSASKIAQLIKDQINKELTNYIEVMAKVKPELFAEPAQKMENIIAENNTVVKERIAKLNERELL